MSFIRTLYEFFILKSLELGKLRYNIAFERQEIKSHK